MLEWTVSKDCDGNDKWVSGTKEILQRVQYNRISYVLKEGNWITWITHPIVYTLEEAKKRAEPEVPFKVGYKENRQWGSFEILAIGEGFVVKQLNILAGKQTSLQKHLGRSENWTVISGSGWHEIGSHSGSILGGTYIRKGSTATIPVGKLHIIGADVDMKVIEVWFGDDLRESDIERF